MNRKNIICLILSIFAIGFHPQESFSQMTSDDPFMPNKAMAGMVSLMEKVIVVTDKRFGAKGDGFMDDSGAIQNAIEAAVNSKQSNIVYVPPGKYLLRKRINLKPNVQLKGSGVKTTFKLPPNFPMKKNIGYAAFGFAEDVNAYPNQFVLDNFRIEMTEAPNDCVGIWFNKKCWKVGISNIQIFSHPSKRHQGILVPEQRYNDAGEPIGHANHNHCIFDNIGFVGLQHPDGVFCVSPNNDAQNWLLNNLAFMRCGFHLNFGGLNSTIQRVYFNTPSGNILRADGKGGKFPRVKLTNSSGPISFRDCYFEGGPDVYVWTTNSANALVTETVYQATGRSLAGWNSILNTVRNPVNGTKTSARTFEVSGNAVANPNYYRVGGKVWVETDNNIKRYNIEAVEFDRGDNKTKVNVDADLDDGITKVFRQLQHTVGDVPGFPTTGMNKYSQIQTNRLIVGVDHPGSIVQQIFKQRFSISKSIHKGTVDKIEFPLDRSVNRVDAAVIVTPPAHTTPQYISLRSASLNNKGNVVSVIIENHSTTEDWIMKDAFWNILIIE